MYKFLLLTLALCLASSSISAQILYPFDFEDELLNERIGYNPAPTLQLPPNVLLDSMQYGEFDGFDWFDDPVIKVARTADYEILSQSWSNQFGDYAYDTVRFLLSGAADSFWIEREESYFNFSTNQRDTSTSSRIGKRWYINGRLDSTRLVGITESNGGSTYEEEITRSFSYGQFGLTSYAVMYSDDFDSYTERTEVSYTSSGEKSGFQVFEEYGTDVELEISATISEPAPNQLQYIIDDFGDEFVVNQFISPLGNADSITYSFDDGSETFMATFARTDDGTDDRFLEYAFISGTFDDPERIRYWLSQPLSGTNQAPLVKGDLRYPNPITVGSILELTNIEAGTQIMLVNGQGRVINSQLATSEQLSLEWPVLSRGLYFIVAQKPGFSTRAWEIIGL